MAAYVALALIDFALTDPMSEDVGTIFFETCHWETWNDDDNVDVDDDDGCAANDVSILTSFKEH